MTFMWSNKKYNYLITLLYHKTILFVFGNFLQKLIIIRPAEKISKMFFFNYLPILSIMIYDIGFENISLIKEIIIILFDNILYFSL